jgi:hypothetical protein
MMPSDSTVNGLRDASTLLWSGFAPDFLKLMSDELHFDYDIVDTLSLCAVEEVEAHRALLRSGRSCSGYEHKLLNDQKECCETAANSYRDDLFLFHVKETIRGDQDTLAPWSMLERNTSQVVGYALGFPFVRKQDPLRGQVLHVHLILHSGIGEHIRSMPISAGRYLSHPKLRPFLRS